MINLNNDVTLNIFFNMDPVTISRFSKVNKYFNNFSKKEEIWLEKIRRNFPFSINNDNTYYDQFKVAYINAYGLGSSKIDSRSIELLTIVKEGDEVAFREKITKMTDLESTDSKNANLIEWANQTALVSKKFYSTDYYYRNKAILNRIYDLSLRCFDGELEKDYDLLFKIACSCLQDIKTIRTLLSTNQITFPIHVAAKSGHEIALKHLLGLKAVRSEINELGPWNKTPLMIAFENRNDKVVYTLLESGAKWDMSELGMLDLLDLAAEHGNVELLRWIISLPNCKKPVFWPIDLSFILTAIQLEQLDFLEAIISLGFNVDQIDLDTGDTLLHIAINKNSPKIVSLLLFLNADTTIENFDDLTPYELAIKEFKFNIANLIQRRCAISKKHSIEESENCLVIQKKIKLENF